VAVPVDDDEASAIPALDQIRTSVDAELRAFLARERSSATGEHPDSTALFDEIERLLDAGGKRLRPAFCIWGYRAGGGRDREAIVRAAAAIELLHTFALIHDDVMDRAVTRRGVVTTHELFAEAHRPEATGDDAQAFGTSMAILVGDLCAVLADRSLDGSGFPPERLLDARRVYDLMRVDTAVGQFLDVTAGGAVDVALAGSIARLKTGIYTIAGPLAIGAALADADPGVRAALEAYGGSLGEAFQVRDDLADVAASPADAGSRKPTVLLAAARAAAARADAPEQDRALLDALPTSLSRDDRRRVAELLTAPAVLDHAARVVNRLVDEAMTALDHPDLPQPVVEALRSLASLVAVRPTPDGVSGEGVSARGVGVEDVTGEGTSVEGMKHGA
jgi:geranylgeranyl diphosphate synthase, type I